ncbi:Uncharacterised protein, partial [Mycoplasma putrefaciens]
MIKKFNSPLIKINDKQPSELITINIKNLDKVDQYKEKQVFYLIYDQNKAIKLVKYQTKNDNKINIEMHPDLFIILNHKNIQKELEDLENKIHQSRANNLDKFLETEKEKFENSEVDQVQKEFINQEYEIW